MTSQPPARSPRAQLRAAGVQDGNLLAELYSACRRDELAVTGWPPAQQDAFLAEQYRFRQAHYAAAYPAAVDSIVVLEGVAVGRMLVQRTAEEIRLVDIALLPAVRGRGIATQLLGGLMDEAAAGNRPLVLHVEAHNPARRLYQRLGFRAVAEGAYLRVEWRMTGREAPVVS